MWLQLCLNSVLRAKLGRLPPEAARYLDAGTCLERPVTVLDEAGVRLSPAERRDCWDNYQRFMQLTNVLDPILQPNRHL